VAEEVAEKPEGEAGEEPAAAEEVAPVEEEVKVRAPRGQQQAPDSSGSVALQQ
jgi:hypothetical protein